MWSSPSDSIIARSSRSTTHGPTPGAGRQASPSRPLLRSRSTTASSGTSISTTWRPARSAGFGIGTADAIAAVESRLMVQSVRTAKAPLPGRSRPQGSSMADPGQSASVSERFRSDFGPGPPSDPRAAAPLAAHQGPPAVARAISTGARRSRRRILRTSCRS